MDMRKTCGLACTVGFGLFWICGCLVALAVLTGQPVESPLVALAGLGGILGVMARVRVVQETQHLPVGTPTPASEQATA
jgi:hypothetical protein